MTAYLKAIWMVMGLSVYATMLRAQNTEIKDFDSDPNHRVGSLPVFFTKDSAEGSPYLVRGWLAGVVDLTSQRRLPEPGHNLFFNYDKLNERLYFIDRANKVQYYPNDSIVSFTLLADSNTSYRFDKVPLISPTHLLQSLVRSEDGYSVYRRVTTRFIAANYKNEGYVSTGKKYDQYIDTFEYFLVYPGKSSFTKVKLTVRAIKKALSPESVRVDKFFAENSGTVNESTFVLLVKYLNDNKK